MLSTVKVPVKCFPIQPIKDQVLQKAFSVEFSTLDISKETWSRYPCKRYENCRTDHCDGNVSFIVTDNALRTVKILKLLFVKENKNAYVSYNRQLQRLFDSNILLPVVPVTILLNPPIETEPTERAVSWDR